MLSQHPEHPDALHVLGLIMYQRGDLVQAEALIRRAIAQNDQVAAYHCHYGVVLRALARLKEALVACEQALRLKPEFAEAYSNRGMMQKDAGYIDAALRDLRRALELRPTEPRALAGYCCEQRVAPDHPAVDILEAALAKPWVREKDAQYYHFALGRLYADRQGPDAAFTHYQRARVLRARRHEQPWNAEQSRADCQALIQRITPAFLAARRDWGHPSTRPIFIVGMPRSGTSLTEQILASHSQVHGAGELAALSELAQRVQPQLTTLTATAAQALAEDYLAALHQANTTAARVSDKMPHNFEHLWLVALLFPNARVIHCERDPIATCWSIYRHNFAKGHGYADDLVTLGEHYRDYQSLMAHWQQVLPIEIHPLRYDALVNDPEPQIRALLAHCGLEFEPACLAPHQTKRAVKTASASQVNQPIYRHADDHWRAYERQLKPLIEVLRRP
ncbi:MULTISPECIES: tetratricopeptide repeat-containing sulfotransferase family protein [Thiorhodovibrio]|uniref:tetratricopeptide repeat-containing sulfotransferase family protein n=1 Tax=Thiorhodovibrio TaxID=61593 RepID=UPI001914A8BB|nr:MULTISPECIES: sulfotransferase family protein [Thiorhodovibrio]MBK5969480.1 hypothetical protein [Thiorhodovibrio winogradskyi]WPL14984.1 type IV pilus biogenesis/stability protein PilW [Thiorhodovibrio litoralis]